MSLRVPNGCFHVWRGDSEDQLQSCSMGAEEKKVLGRGREARSSLRTLMALLGLTRRVDYS